MTGVPTPPSSPFWQFSLGFYAGPGMADAFLTLQDVAGADVNLLLYLFFLASGKCELDGADIARLDAGIASWRGEIVVPLRHLRRRLKDKAGAIPAEDAEALRQAVKRIELEAERLEQETLERLGAALGPWRSAVSEMAAARANLAAYARFFGALPEAALAALLEGFAARF